MRSYPVVVFYEFLVEWKSFMFEVVGSEPSFNLSLRRGFSDSSEDVSDAMPVAVRVET